MRRTRRTGGASEVSGELVEINGRPDNYASLVESYQARPIHEASTIEFDEGSRIRGNFHNGYSYAGVVKSKDGSTYHGTFDDGDAFSLSRSQLTQYPYTEEDDHRYRSVSSSRRRDPPQSSVTAGSLPDLAPSVPAPLPLASVPGPLPTPLPPNPALGISQRFSSASAPVQWQPRAVSAQAPPPTLLPQSESDALRSKCVEAAGAQKAKRDAPKAGVRNYVRWIHGKCMDAVASFRAGQPLPQSQISSAVRSCTLDYLRQINVASEDQAVFFACEQSFHVYAIEFTAQLSPVGRAPLLRAFAMEMKCDNNKELFLATKIAYMNDLQKALRQAAKRLYEGMLMRGQAPQLWLQEEMTASGESSWKTHPLYRHILPEMMALNAELIRRGVLKAKQLSGSSQNADLHYEQVIVLRSFWEWYVAEAYTRSTDTSHSKYGVPLGIFFTDRNKSVSVHYEYATGLAHLVTLDMGLFGLGRVSESYVENTTTSIELIRDPKTGKLAGYWIVPDGTVITKTTRVAKSGHVVDRYPYLVLGERPAESMSAMLAHRPTLWPEEAIENGSSKRLFLSVRVDVEATSAVYYKPKPVGSINGVEIALDAVKRIWPHKYPWPKENRPHTLGSLRSAMNHFNTNWFKCADAVQAQVLMGKVVKGGNANYNRTLGRTMEDILRLAMCIQSPTSRTYTSPVPQELVLMLLQTKPDSITAVSTDRSLLISHLAPEPSHFTLPDASNVALPAEAHSLTQPATPVVSTAQPNPVTPATSRPFAPPGPESTALEPSPKRIKKDICVFTSITDKLEKVHELHNKGLLQKAAFDALVGKLTAQLIGAI